MSTKNKKARSPITKTFILKKESYLKILDEFAHLLSKHSHYIIDIKNFEPINNEDEYVCVIEFKDRLSSEVFLKDLSKLIIVDLYTKQRESIPIKRFFLVPKYYEFEKSMIDLEFKYSESISFYEENLSKYTEFKVLSIDFDTNESVKSFTKEYEQLLKDFTESNNSVKLIYYLYFGKKVIEETTL